jgi:hypothetical protein
VLAPGSYLVLTHATSEHRPDVARKLAAEFARLHVTAPLVPRDATQIRRFFDGFDLVEPGLVSPPQWRPDLIADRAAEPDTRWMFAGVGRLTAPPRQAEANVRGGNRPQHQDADGRGSVATGAGRPVSPSDGRHDHGTAKLAQTRAGLS